MIPKIIHQIWFQGEDKIPEKLKKYNEECKKVNSDYENYIWDDAMIQRLLKDHYPNYLQTYNAFPLMIQKIDFAKYVILYHHGGIYIDMDVRCLKKVSSLIRKFQGNDMILAPSPGVPYQLYNLMTQIVFGFSSNSVANQYYNNGIMIVKKNYDFLLYLCDEITRRLPNYSFNILTRDPYVWVSTGPGIVTRCIMDYKLRNNKSNIKIIDGKYLEPCDGNIPSTDLNEVKKLCDLSDSYFIHIHERSWLGVGNVYVWIQKISNYIKYKMHISMKMVLLLIVLISIYKIIKRKKSKR